MRHKLDEQELLRLIAELPREIRPQNDPWTAISARIERSRNQQPSRRFLRGRMMQAAAASLVLALILGLLLGPRTTETPPGAIEKIAQDNASSGRRAYPLPAILEASEAEYQAAFREFIAVGQARPSLSPQTIETIETGWADLRAAENALAMALAANPDDLFLGDRLLELRARHLGFLQQLASLDQNNRRLTI
jgi:hypothetical protein